MLVKGEPRKDKEMIKYTLFWILNIYVEFNPRWPFKLIQGLDSAKHMIQQSHFWVYMQRKWKQGIEKLSALPSLSHLYSQ